MISMVIVQMAVKKIARIGFCAKTLLHNHKMW